MNKIKSYIGSLAVIATSVLGVAVTHAQAIPAGSISIPSSTAPALLASVGTIFSDPGMELLVSVAIGLPLFFWFIHQLIGLMPRSRGKK